MSGRPFARRSVAFPCRVLGALLLTVGAAGAALAQADSSPSATPNPLAAPLAAAASPIPIPPAWTPAAPMAVDAVSPIPTTVPAGSGLVQTGCSTCGNGLLGGSNPPPLGGNI